MAFDGMGFTHAIKGHIVISTLRIWDLPLMKKISFCLAIFT